MKYPLWNRNEISCYLGNFAKPELSIAYFLVDIKPNEPHKRAEYLIKKLNLSEAEEREIIKKMEEPDGSNTEKPSILSSLEERTMRTFGINQQFFR